MSSPFDQSSFWRRVRALLGLEDPTRGSVRRVSRREREQQNTRMLIAGLGVVALLVIMSLAGGLIYENIVKPNAVLAKVAGHEISRKDYWQYQTAQLYQQAGQYESFASQVEGSQRTQFLTFAAQLRAQAGSVWGTTEVSDATLAQMVEDRVYLQAARDMDLDLSDNAVEAYVLQQFAPAGAELVTPYPEPTLIPTRAAWATQTAEAEATQQAEMARQLGTPVASPVAAGTPGATPVGGATPAGTATPEIDHEEAVNAASADFATFQDEALDAAHMSKSDYLNLIVRPQLARELVTNAVSAGVPQTAPQVKARHILVSTEDLARELYNRATSGADFGQLARTNSIDQATAPTGGELGWFTRSEMVEPFADAAFSLKPGAISQPVQTQFGWHIIQVEEVSEDRPLTQAQYQALQDQAVQEKLDEVRASMSVSSDYDVQPTPTPSPEAFAPPPDAPTPVPATPIPATPGATPVGSPAATPVIEGPMLATPEG
jgi:peptidyl-prolyl cis-trans isomerase C